MLVYDLGGGTFDVSIVQAEEGVVEVLASHGDTQLGGDDFDELLLNHVCDRFPEQHGIDLRSEPRRQGAVAARRRGGQAAAFRSPVRPDRGGVHRREGRRSRCTCTMEVSRGEYEDADPAADRSDDGLRAARPRRRRARRPAQIDKVVLVGGSTRTPLIGRLAGGPPRPAGAPGGQSGPVRGDGGRGARGDHRRRRTSARCWWTSRRTRWASSALDDDADGFGLPFLAPVRADHRPQHAAAGVAQRGLPHRRRTIRRDVEIDVYQGERRRRAPQPPRRPVPDRRARAGRRPATRSSCNST